jgi:serine/threonine protein kinase
MSCTFAVHNGTLEPVAEYLETTPVVALAEGVVIDSKYKIIGKIGEGGMGTVYKVHHLLLQKDMALKTFRSHTLSTESWERFQREARAIAKLKHKNIVEVFDFGIAASNVPYYTMELLSGESVAERLTRCGKIELLEALQMFLQAADALAYAHRQHIVHRDIKPANIFLQEQQSARSEKFQVKIVDFGVAKLAEESSSDENQGLTQSGMIFGSPLYMSPEQSLGLSVDQRTDIYSFGCALFESLVGQPPFVGETALLTLLDHQTKTAPKLKDALPDVVLPQRLEGLMVRLLAKTPEKRYQTFEAVSTDLNYCIEDFGAKRTSSVTNNVELVSQEVGAREVALRPSFSGKVIAMVICLVGAAIVLLSIFNFTPTNQPGEPHTKPKTFSLAPTVTVPKTDDYEMEEHAARLRFKKEREQLCSEKWLFYRGPDARGKEYQFPTYQRMGYFENGNSERLIDCIGSVTLPPGQDVFFRTENEVFFAPQLLERFGENGLVGLHLNPNTVAHVQWTSDQLKHITGLQSIRYLNIGSNNLLDEKALPYIAQLRNLQSLDISQCGITSETLTNLATLPQITTLTVEDDRAQILLKFMAKEPNGYLLRKLLARKCDLHDSDLEALAKLKHIEVLNLERSPIRGPGLKYLAKLPKLVELRLHDVDINPKELALLAQSKSLKLLEINKEKYPLEDVKALQALMPRCKII